MERAHALLLAGLLAAAVSGVADAHEPPPARARAPRLTAAPALPVIRTAPELGLVDTGGEVVRLDALRERVVLVSFVYTRCTGTCPLLTRRLALLQERLRGSPDAASVEILSVTVDPERDTAAALRAYAARFGADLRRWHFLRDEPSRLAPVLRAWDEWTRPGPGGDIDHPARVHLVDGRGRVREIYALEFFDERQAWLDVQALLREARGR
jgi:protein SCO1/2